ncbi:MAG: hypothetical protein JWM41_1354 [Gemmatimonadetes bacterium]|nr:hypothetical protein [Gemmatimonadota bacterium]
MAHAQTPAQTPASASCNGQTISRITVDAGRPPFEGSARKWRAMARAVGLHHATTRASVIRTYLVLREGDVCTDERRAESERILRALPFLADASVRALPDSAGGVRLHIVTTDEIPVLVSGAIRRGGPSALSLGNSNISGLGIRAFAGVERGYTYRNGAHLEASQYAAFGHPLVSMIDLSKDPLGGHVELGLSHPFLTDLQRGSFQATFRRAYDYPTLLRPAGDNVALGVNHERWSVGGVARTEIGGLVALLGGAAMGTRITPGSQAVFVTDSGIVPDPDTAIRRRYPGFNSTRLGGLVGVRRISYSTVTGYDALFASQDIMTGIQIGTLAAPGMVMPGRGDVLVANSAYAGAVIGRSMFGAQFESEARRDFTGGLWDSMMGSGRVAWYLKTSPGVLFNIADEVSVARRSRLPTQLTFSDPNGGVRGYAASRLAGEERNVVRAELRWAHPALIRHSDAGIALFADAGTLWAGEVPYGSNASRQSVGLSILAAYPTQSKRLYRVDFAIPVQRSNVRGIEIRFSSGDPTSAFWTEPDDVTRSRLAPVPSSLFAWPAR